MMKIKNALFAASVNDPDVDLFISLFAHFHPVITRRTFNPFHQVLDKKNI